MQEILKIEKLGHITKITNNSGLDILFSLKPKKPKRKFTSVLIVKDGHYLINENEIDLSTIVISFQDH